MVDEIEQLAVTALEASEDMRDAMKALLIPMAELADARVKEADAFCAFMQEHMVAVRNLVQGIENLKDTDTELAAVADITVYKDADQASVSLFYKLIDAQHERKAAQEKERIARDRAHKKARVARETVGKVLDRTSQWRVELREWLDNGEGES